MHQTAFGTSPDLCAEHTAQRDGQAARERVDPDFLAPTRYDGDDPRPRPCRACGHPRWAHALPDVFWDGPCLITGCETCDGVGDHAPGYVPGRRIIRLILTGEIVAGYGTCDVMPDGSPGFTDFRDAAGDPWPLPVGATFSIPVTEAERNLAESGGMEAKARNRAGDSIAIDSRIIGPWHD